MTWTERLQTAGWHDEGKGYWFQQPADAGLGIGHWRNEGPAGFALYMRDGAGQREGRFDYLERTVDRAMEGESIDVLFDRWLAMPFGKTTIGAVVGVPAAVSPVDVVAALQAAGWTGPHDDDPYGLSRYWIHEAEHFGDHSMVTTNDMTGEEGGDVGWSAFLGDGNDAPQTYGHDSETAALSALMALPFGAVTVGVFCGVAV
jgi:hypothetical protein